MQTVQTLIRRRGLWHLIRVVLGINGLILILHTSESEASCSNIVQLFNNNGVGGGGRYLMNHSKMYNQQQHVYNFLST